MSECTRKCASRRHGSQLTSSITRRAVSDEALAAYLHASCANFIQAFDKEGRTALHMAASRGRKKLVEWLVRNSSDAFVNARDRESGYTPLHRSIFYGQIHIAVALMKMGVKTDIMDKDDYRALDHAMLDRRYMNKLKENEPYNVYVWGSNSNYTLGTETQQQRMVPDELTCFNRNDRSIKQVCLGKFHSVWVDRECGSVWACGQGSRFGAAHAGTVLRPKMLHLSEPEQCCTAAVTIDSTVLLLESGAVFQYRMNESDNLIPNVKSQNTIKLRSVKPLIKLQEPLGLCASRNHAMVWNKRAIYTWGVNYGQLGHSQPSDKYIDTPKRVAVQVNSKEETNIELGAVSEGASLFNTSRGDVYLLHDHICKKIAVKQINLKQLCVECKVSENGSVGRVTVLLLTSLGQVIFWHNAATQLTRLTYGLAHQTLVSQVALTHDAMFFTTKYGEAYIGLISRKSNPSPGTQQTKAKEKDDKRPPLVKLLEKEDCTPVKIKRIPNIHSAVSISVDTEGLNYACLQVNPHCRSHYSPRVSASSLAQQMERLYREAHEDDLLHDVIFKIGNRTFPAHMFVIASGSDLLYTMYQEHKLNNQLEKPIINLEKVHPEVFERIILYLYTGTCDVVEVGPCGLKIKKEDLISEGKKEKEQEEIDLDLIEVPSEISAFEVYKREGEKKKGGRKSKGANTDSSRERTVHTFCDPVKLVQATAKRLQVMSLHKLLDRFYYRDGTICVKESAPIRSGPPLSWDRRSLPELVDTTVLSKDGVPILAHKCILAARLEYFNSMFMHSWTESEKKSTVTLPVNNNILEPIIEFLYTDMCQELAVASIEFLCNLLIVADQLFVMNLREMCELCLSGQVTLKNCTELCQFAHTYNATQLKEFCMEFISLNVCTLLENRSLNLLEEELLEDITTYYCKINRIMSSRVITPFYDAPDEEVIIDCAKLHPVDLTLVDDDLQRVNEVKNAKKKSKPKKIEYTESEKARMRYESVSSVNSLDLSLEKPGDITLALKKISGGNEKVAEEKQEKWVKVQTGQQKQQKVVQARLKAISCAKDVLKEAPAESFTKLTKSWQPSPPMSVSPQNSPMATTSRMSVSLKESPLADDPWKSPQSPIFISHVGAKISQKQRKKLALQGLDPIAPQNIDDFLMNKLSLTESLPKTVAPKNPWKICERPAANGGSSLQNKPVQFNQILADQQKQKENFSRIMTKSLVLTQLEDKAIEDLERFYNTDEADEELITVRRIEIQVSTPQWIHTTPK